MKPDAPLSCHSGLSINSGQAALRAGRNPVMKKIRVADKTLMLSTLTGDFSIFWIPACAGMTEFFLMDDKA